MTDSHEKQAERAAEASKRTDQPGQQEIAAGKVELARKEKEHRQYLKGGGKSGITGTFGKPVLFDKDIQSSNVELGGPYSPARVHQEDGVPVSIEWTDDFGTTTIQVDADGKMTGGQVTSGGSEVAEITPLGGNKAVYDDETTRRLVEIDVAPRRGVPVRELGRYDPDTGTVTKDEGGYQSRESLAPGRHDSVDRNGDLQATTDRGDYYLRSRKRLRHQRRNSSRSTRISTRVTSLRYTGGSTDTQRRSKHFISHWRR